MTSRPNVNSANDPDRSDRPDPTVRGPLELVAAVPTLLGFHPDHSLVLIGLQTSRGGHHLRVTARLDLPASLESRHTRTGDERCNEVCVSRRAHRLAVEHTIEAFRCSDVTHVVAVIYNDGTPGPTTQSTTSTMHSITPSTPSATVDSARGTALARTVVSMLEDVATRSGLELIDAFTVGDGRCVSLLCQDPRCCPPTGRALPERSSELDAASVYAGRTIAASRTALADTLTPAADRETLAPLVRHHADVRAAALTTDTGTAAGPAARWRHSAMRAVLAAARDAADPGDPLAQQTAVAAAAGRDTVARLAVALEDTQVRDAVWIAIDQRRLPRTPLWARLARQVPPPLDTTPLFLHAWQAWRDGDGATANIAVHRVLGLDRGHTAAALLLAALDRGLNPAAVPRLRRIENA